MILHKMLIFQLLSTKLDTETLNRPSDIYVDSHDNIFIADSGNKRILKYNLKLMIF